MTENRFTVFFSEEMLYEATSGFFELEASPFLEVVEQHPENPTRVRNMRAVLQKGPLKDFIDWRTPRAATVEELVTVHDPEYIAMLEQTSVAGKRFGVSTNLHKGLWRPITLAAGAAVEAVDAVLKGETKVAYGLVRPPGHHASRAAVDGYCFCNNTAIAAERAVRAGHRVAVIDIDVHHGNGTQSIFYHRADVLTVSMHQDMGAWEEGTAHSETGGTEEVGAGAGVGFNLNIPLELGSGDSAHVQAFESIVEPEVERFAPTFLVVACGVDGSQFDPNGRQALTMRGYFDLAQRIRKLADRLCDGRLVLMQEGGYALSYAAYCVNAVMEGARMLAMVERLKAERAAHLEKAAVASS